MTIFSLKSLFYISFNLLSIYFLIKWLFHINLSFIRWSMLQNLSHRYSNNYSIIFLKKNYSICDALIPGCPVDHRQPAENLRVSYHETHTRIKMATSDPYIHTHQNIINYIFIVFMPVLQNYLYMFTKIFTQSHISAFFSKAASSEHCLPEYSLYLKEGGPTTG